MGGFSPVFCHLWAPVAEVALVTVVEVGEVVEVAGVTLLASSPTTVVRLFRPKSTFATADISAAAPSLCIFTWTAGVGVEGKRQNQPGRREAFRRQIVLQVRVTFASGERDGAGEGDFLILCF